MVGTLLDQFKAATMRRAGAKFLPKTVAVFKRVVKNLKTGKLKAAERASRCDPEIRAIWLDAVERQTQKQDKIRKSIREGNLGWGGLNW